MRLAHGLSAQEKVRGAALAGVTLICGLATWLPVAATAFESHAAVGEVGSSWRPQMQSLVMVAFVGGLVACVAYARTIARQLRAQHAPYVAEGAAIICVLSAAYVAFAAIDSHLFFSVEGAQKIELRTSRDDANRSGLAALAYCERGAAFLLAALPELTGDRSFTVRCPRTIALGAGSAKPFLPWPSYDQVTADLPRP